MTKIILSAIGLLSCALAALAQPSPDTLWTRTYGGSNDDYASSIQQTTDGGYVVAGTTYYFGSGYPDFYVVKTDAQGDTLWTQIYGGSGEDQASSIKQTTDGGYVIAGHAYSFSGGGFYVVKTDTQGDTLWTGTYGGSEAESIERTTDGGYVIAGTNCQGGCGFYVVKIDAQGDSLWTRTYGGIGHDQAYSIQQTTDGGYVVAGWSDYFNTGNDDFYVVKTDAQGDTLWTHRYGGNSTEWARSIQQTTDGGYVVAGYTDSFGGARDLYVVKTDEQGNTLWTRTYGGPGVEEALSIQQTTDGGYVVAGFTSPSVQSFTDYYVVKINAQGDTLWTRTYGGGDNDIATSFQQTTDSGLVIAGYTYAINGGTSDFYVVKTGPDVPQVPVPAISVTPTLLNFSSVFVGDSAALAMVIHSTGDTDLVLSSIVVPTDFHTDLVVPIVILPGDSMIVQVTFAPTEARDYVDTLFIHSNALDSIVIVRLFGTGLANSASDLIPHPSSFSLSAYPNPFNPSTEIRYDLPRSELVTLRIVDVLGREVAVLINETMPAGSHRIGFDGSQLPSGLYFAKFQAGAFARTGKIILMK